MILVPIALFVIVIDFVQFIGCFALFYVCTDVVLDGIIDKLQCFEFCVKRAMNRVPVYEITFILSF